MEIIVKSPRDCTDAELRAFENLVTAGGEVAVAGLRGRIQRAEKLVLVNEGECVAVAAIKNPNAAYKARVFEKSEVPSPDQYEFELGWIYVSEAARGKGYGRVLMESMVGELSGGACFATTRESNAPMHHLLNRFGFSKLGKPYESKTGGYSLVLYAKR